MYLTSANTSTWYRYSEKIRNSILFGVEYHVEAGVIVHSNKILIINTKFGSYNSCFMFGQVIDARMNLNYSCEHGSIRGKIRTGLGFGIHVNTNLVYQYQTLLRLRNQMFEIRFGFELQIGTPLRQNLLVGIEKFAVTASSCWKSVILRNKIGS